MDGRIRILVADDHELVRRGIRVLLEMESGWKVCAETATRPDVAILDISMPELNGVDDGRPVVTRRQPKEQTYSVMPRRTRIVKPLAAGTSKNIPVPYGFHAVVPSSCTSQLPAVISMRSGALVAK
jgi:CheY-like chemotaxis protein